MPVALSADQLSAVVTRLRAAGCVYAEEEAALLVEAADNLVRLEEMVQGRCTGLPVEQVVGWAQFCGLRIQLEPGVFVPRRRTEFLVRVAVALLPRTAVVVDLCCGSGAAGAAVRAAGLAGGGEVELHAADVDPAAVRCARRNVRGAVHEGDLYAPLPAALRGHVDVLLANAPYVPSDEVPLMPAEARLHEHPVALDGGPDGLDVQRRVAADAGSWLAPGGHLLIETSRRQAAGTLALVRRGGLLARTERCDDLDATVVVGTRCG